MLPLPLRCSVGLLLLVGNYALAQSGIFTLQVGTPPTPPTPLVRYNEPWHFHKGTNAPQPGWARIDDEDLDSTWAIGPGGFGFSDNDDNTVLSDMLNRYTTVYIRRSFSIPDGADTNRHLRLVMDWDDGFVAFIDGVEVARSSNVSGAGEPPHTATTVAGQNHEASAGGGPPPTAFDLGAIGNLNPGTHVLAVIGLNAAPSSSDFTLIADLVVAGGDAGVAQDGLFALVRTNSVVLSGSNTFPNSARVVVNGHEANFDIGNGTWTRAHPLEPNMNRIFIAALDAQGHILASTNKDIVSEVNTMFFSGIVVGNTGISASNAVVRVTNNITIPPGARLTVGENSVLLLSPNTFIRVQTNGELRTIGSYGRPVFFLPADGVSSWGEISASGAGALVNLSHTELVASQIRPLVGSTALLQDCVMRELMNVPGREMIAAVNAAAVTLRRSHLFRFAEVDSRETPFLAEDCLVERVFVDAFDVKSTNAPITLRRTTMRFGAVLSGEVDADGVDLGPGRNATVDSCLIHDFDDKGVSIGTSAHGSTIINSLIYNCGLAGISAYSSSNCVVSQNTISLCSTGLFLRNNPGPALITGTNNIVWGNGVQVGIHGTSSAQLTYSDVQGGAPGQGNIDADPLFVNPSAGNFRLSSGSPALGSGFGGANMGAQFPVGGIPPAPFNLAVLIDGTNPLQLEWQEDADNENGFVIERSDDGATWYYLGAALPNTTSYVDAEAAVGQRHFYRVRAENSSGISRWSNIAAGTREVPTTHVGGTLSQNTVWSPALGNIVVISSVIVPTNISLTMLPGTTVFITNGASILAAAGGAIQISGNASNRVVIAPRVNGVVWRELSAQGAGASLVVRHADISGGQTTVYSNAVGLLEDSYFHDYRASGSTFTQPIVLSSFAREMTVRRCHVREYYETLFRDGVIVIEDCLFEYMSGDALDFDGAQPGTVLRRSTFRHGTRAPSNIDAVDVGPGQLGRCRDVIIEDCLMFDFPTDKGVSIGDSPNQAIGTIVRNCLIYGCLSGVQVKDGGFAEVYQCTIVNNRWGFTNYNKVNPSGPSGGGHTTNAHNNILWDNATTISMWNAGTLTADHCNFGNTNWPGEGNINIDPQFVNAAQRDYRLSATSPCLGAGRNGADIGAQFPVGARMAPSHPILEAAQLSGNQIILRFWADNEKNYTLESAESPAGPWSDAASVPAPSLPKLTEVRLPRTLPTLFYRLTATPLP